MKQTNSPSDVELLLHCYYCPDPHPRYHAPAITEGIKKLIRLGAIEATVYSNIFATTPLGVAWVKAICNVQPPRSVFVDEKGKILV